MSRLAKPLGVEPQAALTDPVQMAVLVADEAWGLVRRAMVSDMPADMRQAGVSSAILPPRISALAAGSSC
jgi:hypothetical protein